MRSAVLAEVAIEVRPSPFLHVGADRVYNPLTDRTLRAGEAGYELLRARLSGAVQDDDSTSELLAGGWLVPAKTDVTRQFYLKYVSLEAHTVCNQSCYFCPVSVAPREDYFMPTELYERIVGELAEFRSTIEAVIMIAYNEPTVDRRFVEQVRTIRAAGLPPAVLSNGTGLTPDRVDAIVAMGGLKFLSINLSTLDRQKYDADRGGDHLGLVLRNLDYLKDRPLAEQMDMAVLGTGDERHRADFDAIRERFAGSRFDVKYFEVNDRAGYLQVGWSVKGSTRRLRGCDLVGSRPLQHLHINPRGQCVLCCQDYNESHIVGDLTGESVRQVLTGPELAKMRSWTYGIEDAPANFICRSCKFAITE